LTLLLALVACDINQPKAPRLEGQWQCANGIEITFSGPQNYTATSLAGETTGVYKLTTEKNDFHAIEWNPGVKDGAKPLPSRFRYFETDKRARLYFYTDVVDEAVPCERRL
jgi:hypothetical protein